MKRRYEISLHPDSTVPVKVTLLVDGQPERIFFLLPGQSIRSRR